MAVEWVVVILPWGLFFAGVLWLVRRLHGQRSRRRSVAGTLDERRSSSGPAGHSASPGPDP